MEHFVESVEEAIDVTVAWLSTFFLRPLPSTPQTLNIRTVPFDAMDKLYSKFPSSQSNHRPSLGAWLNIRTVPFDAMDKLYSKFPSSQSNDVEIPHVESLQEVELHLQEELGQGAFGTVRVGTFHSQRVAVKLISGSTSTQEAQILFSLAAEQHPNILQLQACFSHRNELLLVTELICGSDLETVLFNSSDDGVAYLDQLRSFTSSVVQAVAFLHSHRIGHFDLKGTNIMVGEGGTLKIIDFGMAEIVVRPLTIPKQSTAHYLAPEVMRTNRNIDQTGYGLAADVWSLGICLYYWYTGYFPFGDDEDRPFDIYNAVLYGEACSYEDFEQDGIEVLVASLLRFRPGDRPTSQDLAQRLFQIP